MIKWLKSWSPSALLDYNIKALSEKANKTEQDLESLRRMEDYKKFGSW